MPSLFFPSIIAVYVLCWLPWAIAFPHSAIRGVSSKRQILLQQLPGEQRKCSRRTPLFVRNLFDDSTTQGSQGNDEQVDVPIEKNYSVMPGGMNWLEKGLHFELHPSIASIPAEMWDAYLATDGSSSPFLRHSWIRCLEESKCASPATGWVPQHVSIHLNGRCCGFVPLYIKGHSMGEFIFDQSWAEAAYDLGIQYYPKLLVGVPFTPATGGRILLRPDLLKSLSRNNIKELRQLTGNFLIQIAQSNKVSSVHLNFITDDEATDLSGPLPESGDDSSRRNKGNIRSIMNQILFRDTNDFLRRTSLQYHWTNSNANTGGKPYESFEDYLSCFKSKRRITIRRERQKVTDEENIRIDAVVGKEILKYPGLVERIFQIYLSTVDKLIWGRQYLTVEFFQCLAQSDFIDHLCFMCARHKNTGEELKAEDVFAGTFNIVKDGVFYGRYWGCLPGRRVKNLHFETCYWAAIEFCIDNGLHRMEPGAGGGDYKWARGFDPALIHSCHYLCHPSLRKAVSNFLDYETAENIEVREYLVSKSAVGSRSNKEDDIMRQ